MCSDFRVKLTVTCKRSDWAVDAELCQITRSRNCHRNDANYVEKLHLDLKGPSALASHQNERKLDREKNSWQRKLFSGVKNLCSAPLNTYCSFSRWFDQNWQEHSPQWQSDWLRARIVSFYDMACQVFNTSWVFIIGSSAVVRSAR